MERQGLKKESKKGRESGRDGQILPVGLISAQLIGLCSSLPSIAWFTLRSSAMCVHGHVQLVGGQQKMCAHVSMVS